MKRDWLQLTRAERRGWEIKARNASHREFIATGQWRGLLWMAEFAGKRMYLAS